MVPLCFLFGICVVSLATGDNSHFGAKHSNSANLPTFPNIGYLGEGYDIVLGNPQCTTNNCGVGIDPGFKSAVFDLSQNSSKVTPDKRYSIPFGTQVLSCLSCELSFEYNEFTSTLSYQNQLEDQVSANYSGWGFAFSASADYQSISNIVEKEDYISTSSYASCAIYCANIDHYTPPALTENFIVAVSQLPLEYEQEVYREFVYNFGTHVMTGAKMGGRFGQVSTFNYDDYSQLNEQGIKISAAAGYSVMISAGALSALTNDQAQEGTTFSNLASSQDIFTIGSRIPSDGSPYSWAQNTTISPMPISYRLESIDNILTSQFFLNDSNIETKQNNIRIFFSQYCNMLNGHCNTPTVPSNDTYFLRMNATCTYFNDQYTNFGDYFANFAGSCRNYCLNAYDCSLYLVPAIAAMLECQSVQTAISCSESKFESICTQFQLNMNNPENSTPWWWWELINQMYRYQVSQDMPSCPSEVSENAVMSCLYCLAWESLNCAIPI